MEDKQVIEDERKRLAAKAVAILLATAKYTDNKEVDKAHALVMAIIVEMYGGDRKEVLQEATDLLREHGVEISNVAKNLGD